MTSLIEIPSLRRGYAAVRDAIISRGAQVAPRGQSTIELLDAKIVIADPTDSFVVGVGRQLNTKIGFLEAAQLIAGVQAPFELIQRVAPTMAEFAAEPDGTYWGNYGARIGTQMLLVENKLKSDRDTRQAVITLWDPQLDAWGGKRDHPCTVALGFAIRNDKLKMFTQMRSNDFWLGLPYDVFQFTQAQLALAASLGVAPGAYHHGAWSLHIYERDLKKALQVEEPQPDAGGFRFTTSLGDPSSAFIDRMIRARMILQGESLIGMTAVEKAYVDAFR